MGFTSNGYRYNVQVSVYNAISMTSSKYLLSPGATLRRIGKQHLVSPIGFMLSQIK